MFSSRLTALICSALLCSPAVPPVRSQGRDLHDAGAEAGGGVDGGGDGGGGDGVWAERARQRQADDGGGDLLPPAVYLRSLVGLQVETGATAGENTNI